MDNTTILDCELNVLKSEKDLKAWKRKLPQDIERGWILSKIREVAIKYLDTKQLREFLSNIEETSALDLTSTETLIESVDNELEKIGIQISNEGFADWPILGQVLLLLTPYGISSLFHSYLQKFDRYIEKRSENFRIIDNMDDAKVQKNLASNTGNYYRFDVFMDKAKAAIELLETLLEAKTGQQIDLTPYKIRSRVETLGYSVDLRKGGLIELEDSGKEEGTISELGWDKRNLDIAKRALDQLHQKIGDLKELEEIMIDIKNRDEQGELTEIEQQAKEESKSKQIVIKLFSSLMNLVLKTNSELSRQLLSITTKITE